MQRRLNGTGHTGLHWYGSLVYLRHLHLDQRRALAGHRGHPLPDALLGGGDEGSRVVLLVGTGGDGV